MRQETIEVFTFNELSDQAKAKARESFRDINTDHDWYEYTFDDWKEKLEAIGFLDPKIAFSGFWSQGDGACFDISSADMEKLITHLIANGNPQFKKLLRINDSLSCSIARNSFATHYSHSNTRYVSVEFEGKGKRIEALAAELEEALERLRRELSDQIYHALEETYEALTTDEAIDDTIIANEYEFTKDGKQYY